VRAKQHEYRATQAQEITAGLRPNPPRPTAAISSAAPPSILSTFWHSNSPSSSAASAGVDLMPPELPSGDAAELDDVRRQTWLRSRRRSPTPSWRRRRWRSPAKTSAPIDEVERLQRIRAEKGDISELELTRIQVQRFAFRA